MTLFTTDQVRHAVGLAIDEVQDMTGEQEVITLFASLSEPDNPGPLTREQVITLLNNAAEAAKGIYNPEEQESEDTIIADSTGDLLVNLALGWLDCPGCDADEVIARQWQDLDLDGMDLERFQVWSEHHNDLGDYCPWSGERVPGNREALVTGTDPEDEHCPQGCQGSCWTDPEPGTPAYKAAIAVTVRGWIS